MDPRTPVVVGVGDVVERIDDPGYAAMSTAELAAAAARAAIADAGGTSVSDVADAVDAIACVRPMELSGPFPSPLGAPVNYARAVARRAGVRPQRAVLEVVGGQSPQRLVNELAAEVAAGRHGAVLLAGAGAGSTFQRYQHAEDRPDHSDPTDGPVEDRGSGWEYYLDDTMVSHGLFIMPAAYGLAENARRLRLGQDPASYRRSMAELFAPFTAVAASHPLAAVRQQRSAEELAEPTERNPLVWDPYPKSLIAREKVNLGAAVLLMSVEVARRCGIPEDRWVHLHGHADLADAPFLERTDLGRGPASVAAVEEALRVADIGVDDLGALDLYSCFAVPVFNICDGLGLAPDDPRGLTVTGGLPFFGGPDNNYSMHATVDMVRRLRERPGAYGLVGANGGILSKYSAGVYSTAPREWVGDRSAEIQAALDGRPRVPVTRHADGTATLETYSLRHGDDPTGTVVSAVLDSDGSRCVALVEDEALLEVLRSGDVQGLTVKIASSEGPNTATPA